MAASTGYRPAKPPGSSSARTVSRTDDAVALEQLPGAGGGRRRGRRAAFVEQVGARYQRPLPAGGASEGRSGAARSAA